MKQPNLLRMDLLLVNMVQLEKIDNNKLKYNHNLHFKLLLARPLLPPMCKNIDDIFTHSPNLNINYFDAFYNNLPCPKTKAFHVSIITYYLTKML